MNKLRILSFILALTAVLNFSACSEVSNEKEENENNAQADVTVTDTDTEIEQNRTYIGDDLDNQDFNGYDFRILSCNFYNRELANYITYDELTGDPVNDVLYNSKIYIEDRFNVGVRWIETGDTAAGMTAAQTSVIGGDDAFDILIGHDGNTISLGDKGYLYNLFDIKQFNFDKPWWPANTVDSLRVGDKLFAASSYLSYCGLHWTRALTINKDYADEIKMEIPYNDVREGKWTMERLYQLTHGASMDLDGNGIINTRDKVALTAGNQIWYCLQESVKLPFYSKDENWIPYLDVNIERAEKYVELLRNLVNTEDYILSGDFGIDVFENGQALFAFTEVGDAYDYFRISDVRYGFLPAPKLDEAQDVYINCCTDVPWALPKTLSESQADIVGTIIEAMSCYNYNNVLPAYFEKAIKSRMADAPDDAEMLQLIADTRTIGFAYNYNLTFRNIADNCVLGSQNVSSFVKSNERVAKRFLEKLIENYSTME